MNAIKHSDAGTTVSVVVTVQAGHARLEVRDEGSGIAPELLPHVFERYRQAAGHMPRSGLGLGLAIVRELVVLHGGRIEAASPGVGQGATFTVVLPLARDSRSPRADMDPTRRGARPATSATP